jgi:transcription termination/antitermination protein NusG
VLINFSPKQLLVFLILLKVNIQKMADNNSKKWYVVRAVSGQENKIKSYIETEISRLGMSDYISQVLVPTEKVVQVRDGKKVSKDKVYFPGYVMIEANLTGEIPHIIKSITGVIGFLGEVKGGDPVPLRLSEVNRMLGKVDELAVNTDTQNIPFNIGETIKVIDGPFNGFNGTIEKINEEKRKLEVMVKIFGRKTPLELSFMQVEKV